MSSSSSLESVFPIVARANWIKRIVYDPSIPLERQVQATSVGYDKYRYTLVQIHNVCYELDCSTVVAYRNSDYGVRAFDPHTNTQIFFTGITTRSIAPYKAVFCFDLDTVFVFFNELYAQGSIDMEKAVGLAIKNNTAPAISGLLAALSRIDGSGVVLASSVGCKCEVCVPVAAPAPAEVEPTNVAPAVQEERKEAA